MIFTLLVAAALCPGIADPTSTRLAAPAVQAPEALVEQGNRFYQQGEYQKALILYRKAEERGANTALVAFNVGNCLYQLNRFPEAAAAFRKAVRSGEGSHAPSLFNLASVLFRLGQYGESIASYRRGLRLDPENVDAWIYLADAHVRTRDPVGALRALEKARALDPEDLALVYQQAEVHASLKESDKAVQLVREALARHPDEVDFLFYIGDLFRAENRFEEAAAAYREGLARRPDDPESLYKLADALVLDDKPFLAMEQLQIALALKPDYADAAIFLGNLAFDSKWWDRAQSAYLQALRTGNREGLEGLRNMAYEYHQQGWTARSVDVLESALTAAPDNPELRREIGTYRYLLEPETSP